MPAPAVSAIMPFHDNVRYARDAIGSLARQSFQDWELILISDGAPEATRNIMRGYAETICPGRYTLLHYPERRGPNYARNYGIQRARGLCCAVADSDNVSDPDRFAMMVPPILEGGADVVYSDIYAGVDPSDKNALYCTKAPAVLSRALFLGDRWSGVPHALIYRTSIARDFPYPAYIRGVGGDTLFVSMLYLYGSTRWAYIPKPLTFYRLHNEGIWGAERRRHGIDDPYAFPGADPRHKEFARWLRYIEGLNAG